MHRRISILLLLLLTPTVLLAEPLVFKDARIPEAPPGAQAMAAYMTIVNQDDRERAITKITSQEFGKVEMHESFIKDGVAGMRPVETLKIPAHGSVALAPGGKHLMLIEPKKDYHEGELIVLYLSEADGTEHSLLISVKKAQGQQQHHQHE